MKAYNGESTYTSAITSPNTSNYLTSIIDPRNPNVHHAIPDGESTRGVMSKAVQYVQDYIPQSSAFAVEFKPHARHPFHVYASDGAGRFAEVNEITESEDIGKSYSQARIVSGNIECSLNSVSMTAVQYGGVEQHCMFPVRDPIWFQTPQQLTSTMSSVADPSLSYYERNTADTEVVGTYIPLPRDAHFVNADPNVGYEIIPYAKVSSSGTFPAVDLQRYLPYMDGAYGLATANRPVLAVLAQAGDPKASVAGSTVSAVLPPNYRGSYKLDATIQLATGEANTGSTWELRGCYATANAAGVVTRQNELLGTVTFPVDAGGRGQLNLSLLVSNPQGRNYEYFALICAYTLTTCTVANGYILTTYMDSDGEEDRDAIVIFYNQVSHASTPTFSLEGRINYEVIANSALQKELPYQNMLVRLDQDERDAVMLMVRNGMVPGWKPVMRKGRVDLTSMSRDEVVVQTASMKSFFRGAAKGFGKIFNAVKPFAQDAAMAMIRAKTGGVSTSSKKRKLEPQDYDYEAEYVSQLCRRPGDDQDGWNKCRDINPTYSNTGVVYTSSRRDLNDDDLDYGDTPAAPLTRDDPEPEEQYTGPLMTALEIDYASMLTDRNPVLKLQNIILAQSIQEPYSVTQVDHQGKNSKASKRLVTTFNGAQIMTDDITINSGVGIVKPSEGAAYAIPITVYATTWPLVFTYMQDNLQEKYQPRYSRRSEDGISFDQKIGAENIPDSSTVARGKGKYVTVILGDPSNESTTAGDSLKGAIWATLNGIATPHYLQFTFDAEKRAQSVGELPKKAAIVRSVQKRIVTYGHKDDLRQAGRNMQGAIDKGFLDNGSLYDLANPTAKITDAKDYMQPGRDLLTELASFLYIQIKMGMSTATNALKEELEAESAEQKAAGIKKAKDRLANYLAKATDNQIAKVKIAQKHYEILADLEGLLDPTQDAKTLANARRFHNAVGGLNKMHESTGQFLQAVRKLAEESKIAFPTSSQIAKIDDDVVEKDTAQAKGSYFALLNGLMLGNDQEATRDKFVLAVQGYLNDGSIVKEKKAKSKGTKVSVVRPAGAVRGRVVREDVEDF